MGLWQNREVRSMLIYAHLLWVHWTFGKAERVWYDDRTLWSGQQVFVQSRDSW